MLLLATFIGLVIFVVFALDWPFPGDLGVRPGPYQSVFDQLIDGGSLPARRSPARVWGGGGSEPAGAAARRPGASFKQALGEGQAWAAGGITQGRFADESPRCEIIGSSPRLKLAVSHS